MNKNYLALFDLDGTLFDTGNVNYYAYKEALGKYGIELDREYFLKECNGRHYTEFLPFLMNTPDYLEDVHRIKKFTYAANLDKARKNRHLFEIINSLRDTYHTAIVTTASRQNTLDILSFFGYENFFEFLVTQEDITKVKPNPQGFLIAMEHFGILPENTIIFEDSNVGIQAAKATKATVMIVNQF